MVIVNNFKSFEYSSPFGEMLVTQGIEVKQQLRFLIEELQSNIFYT
jgi:hypothetical protein